MDIKKSVLLILDGFAFGDISNKFNPLNVSKIETLQYLRKNYINYELFTSGKEIGLNEGQIGNSEVGHLTIGGGKIIQQSLQRINQAFNEKKIDNLKIIKEVKNYCKSKDKKTIHFIGLFSKGGVHSFYLHFIKMIEIFKQYSNISFKLHIFTDGRDCGQKDFIDLIDFIDNFKKENSLDIEIATICGRFYSMDRDKRYERTYISYINLVGNNSLNDKIETEEIYTFHNIKDYIQNSYNNLITDEFIKPARSINFKGFDKKDIVFFMNFRADRMRQFISFLCDENLKSITYNYNNLEKTFNLKNKLNVHKKIALMDYFSDKSILKDMNIDILFKKKKIKDTISEIISKNNKTQTKIAETEKYAHVTFFFNGEREKPFKNENRILIPSPKVERYDEKPEMSIKEVCKSIISEIDKKIDFICVNIANCDMIGHTGNFEACKKTLEYLDKEINKIYQKCKENNYTLIITSDHGNIEDLGCDKKCNTAHTLNKVPLILVDEKYKKDNLNFLSKHNKLIKYLEENKNNLSLADIKKIILEIK